MSAVEAATRLSREEGLSEKVRFSVGDTRSLDLPDASFDAALPHTLVSHVYDTAAVIQEAGHHRKRVCRSTGDARHAKALAEIRAAA